MRTRVAGGLLLAGCVLVAGMATQADEVKSGPDKKTGGAFQVKAITGGQAGKQLCYV